MSKTTIAIRYGTKDAYRIGDVARIIRKRFGDETTKSDVRRLLSAAMRNGKIKGYAVSETDETLSVKA